MGRFCPLCRGSGNVKTTVHYDRIAAAFTSRGMLNPEIQDLASDHLSLAKMLSPVRTGRMRNNHYKRVMPARGLHRDYHVGTRAGYALFVLGGTAGDGTGYITPKKGKELELRPQPYSWFKVGSPGRFKTRVKGQKHQENWLAIAGSEAMAYNGLGSSRFPNMVPKGR
jgi:hypothetical protein